MDVRLLGQLEVDEGERVQIDAPKQRAVLEVLAVFADTDVAALTLIDAIWGDSPPPTAAKSLHSHVSRLRRLLPEGAIVTDGQAYRLDLDPDDVDAYLTGIIEGEWFFDEAVCLQNVVQGAHWAAGPYIWFGGSTAVRQGITAVHLDDDGLIDRQVDFYSARPGGKLAQRIDNGTGVLSIGMQYCSAWGDPYGGDFSEQPDPDRIVSLMSAEPTIHGPTTLTGAEQIRTFAENAEWDRNECSVEVQAVQWEAFANRLFDDDTGSIWEGVNVIALDANELVTDHWPLLEVVP